MKTAISVPEDVFRQVDRAAQELGWSRSQFYTEAVREYLLRRGVDPVTQALDGLVDDLSAQNVPESGRELIQNQAWEW